VLSNTFEKLLVSESMTQSKHGYFKLLEANFKRLLGFLVFTIVPMQVLVDPNWSKTSARTIILHQNYHTCQFLTSLNQLFVFLAKNRPKETLGKFSGEKIPS
jgi:hypothetical protein